MVVVALETQQQVRKEKKKNKKKKSWDNANDRVTVGITDPATNGRAALCLVNALLMCVYRERLL